MTLRWLRQRRNPGLGTCRLGPVSDGLIGPPRLWRDVPGLMKECMFIGALESHVSIGCADCEIERHPGYPHQRAFCLPAPPCPSSTPSSPDTLHPWDYVISGEDRHSP